MLTFGDDWTRALIVGSNELGVDPRWVLAVCALESGFNPKARNPSGAFGLFQRMPPYSVTDPQRQLEDYFAFTAGQARTFGTLGFSWGSREVLYCANLAPARLARYPHEGEQTVLYSTVKGHYAYWPAGYSQNRHLDSTNRGDIRICDLAGALDRAIALNRARYDAECTAIEASADSSPTG